VPNDFALYTPIAVQERIEETNRTFTLYLPLASAFAIIVGAFVVATLMFMTVSDRRPEIGLRKAVGARPADIRWQFLAEATMITTAGGALAVLIGYGALKAAAWQNIATIPLPLSVAALGAGIAIAVGVAAGLAPARRAAALDPVEALR
jgi:putative ABC transport system permease protein